MIKVVAFDFDNTLYNGVVDENYREYMTMVLSKMIKDKDRVNKILDEARTPDGKYHNESVYLKLKEKGENYRRYNRILKHKLYEHSSTPKIISAEFLKGLSKKYYLYLISMSAPNYINHYLKKYGIDKKIFKKCYSVDLNHEPISKAYLYEKILKREKISKDEMLMVGDNYYDDIETAKEVGIKHLYYNTGDFNQIYDYFKNLL